MRVVRERSRLSAQPGRPERAALAIGNFDGVHRGHQALLAATRAAAARLGAEAMVLTFDPHPARFFAPALAPPMITTLERRLELLAGAGIETAIIEPFTAELAKMEAEPFVTDVLKRDIGACHVVVGYDFSFGRERRGSAALLAAMGKQIGLEVTVVPRVMVDGLTCSSTKIREFVLEGRMDGARLLLGRPFEISGRVVTGAGRGRQLGIPTANLAPDGELLPKTGIYAAVARRLDDPRLGYAAAVSVGTNPTFTQQGSADVTVEAHLLDFAGDLYDARLRLELEKRLRDERRFASVEELVEQIHKDIEQTRELLT